MRAPASRSARVQPLSPQRFALQLTIGQATRDKLERARDLMRHGNPRGDLAEILDRALDLLLADIEKQKFGKATRPRAPKARPDGADPRYASNHVRRIVHDRDAEQCTFVDEHGVRCTSRAFLEYDHRTLACRGGQPTVEGMGLMCKAHNQYLAERALGADFMREKRAAAKRDRAARKDARATSAAPPEGTHEPSVATSAVHVDLTPPPTPSSDADVASGTHVTSDTDRASDGGPDAALVWSNDARGTRCSEDLTRLYRSRRVAGWGMSRRRQVGFTPKMLRAMMRRWICPVPSKMS